MTYRTVVIGCGTIGSSPPIAERDSRVRSHAHAYRLHGRTELVGLADVDAERRTRAQEQWGVEAVADGIELCRRLNPDIVSICTPDETHADLAMRLLDSTPPRLLFIEKPLALRVADARAVIEAAEKRGVAVSVNHSRRFSPAFRAVAADIGAGRYARPRLLRILYGKGLMHNGVHAIDLARLWLGEPTGCNGRPVTWGPPGDPTYDAELTFDGNARAILEAFDERVATVFEGDLFTDRMRVRFWSSGDDWEFSERAESTTHPGYVTYVPNDRARTDMSFTHALDDCLLRAVDDLVSHLENRTPLLSPGTDGLAALEWIERLRAAD